MANVDLGSFSVEPMDESFILVCTYQDGTRTIFQSGTRQECQEMLRMVQHDLGLD